MTTFLRTTVVVFSGLAFVVGLSTTLGAAPQEPGSAPPASLERIRVKLEQAPAPQIRDMKWPLPVATFKTGVDQRVFVLSLQEQLRKEFTLTLLQRQSYDWASKCCGLSLDQIVTSVHKALQRRKVRKIRQRIARELAELEAAGRQR